MSNFDYINAQNLALRLISQFGQSTKIVRVDRSDYDPVTGETNSSKVFVTDATVVSLPSGSLNSVSNFDNKYKEDLKAGKIRFFYLAHKGLTFSPQQGDYLIFEGRVWDLAGATPLNPAGVPVLYTIGCRVGNLSSFSGIVMDALNQEVSEPINIDDLIVLINGINIDLLTPSELPFLP